MNRYTSYGASALVSEALQHLSYTTHQLQWLHQRVTSFLLLLILLLLLLPSVCLLILTLSLMPLLLPPLPEHIETVNTTCSVSVQHYDCQ
jgi:hypothetical protein